MHKGSILTGSRPQWDPPCTRSKRIPSCESHDERVAPSPHDDGVIFENHSSDQALYVEITLPDVSQAWQCYTDILYPKRHVNMKRRVNMVVHLRDEHNIHINISRRKFGHPIDATHTRVVVDVWFRQAKTRFENLEEKLELACKKYERGQYVLRVKKN